MSVCSSQTRTSQGHTDESEELLQAKQAADQVGTSKQAGWFNTWCLTNAKLAQLTSNVRTLRWRCKVKHGAILESGCRYNTSPDY